MKVNIKKIILLNKELKKAVAGNNQIAKEK
jgi:hypothetical protein